MPRSNEQLAATDLGAAPAEGPTPAYLVALLSSKDVGTRWRARAKLVALGRSAVPALSDALAKGRGKVRWEAAKTLVEIADPSSAPSLVRALEDENGDIRWLAAEGLIAVGRGGVRALLETLVKRPDSDWLQEGAHHVLRKLVRNKWGRPLSQVLAALDDAEPDLRLPMAAGAALRALENS